MESGLGEGCQERPSPTHTFGSSQTQGGLFLEAERAPPGASHPTWHMGKPPREAGKGPQGFVSHTAHGASRLGGQRCSVQKGEKCVPTMWAERGPEIRRRDFCAPRVPPPTGHCWPTIVPGNSRTQNGARNSRVQPNEWARGPRLTPTALRTGQWGSLHSEHLLSIVGPERLISL